MRNTLASPRLRGRGRSWIARAALALVVAANPALVSSAAAQGVIDPNAKTLFTWRDAALAGGFAVLTVAMFPVDRHFARRLQDPRTQASHVVKNASRAVQYVADPGSLFIGVGLYGVGRIAHWREVADLGLHGTEAIVLSGTVTGLLKGIAGRARPYMTADTNAHDFKLGRGFGDGRYQSFPSGHTTAAFAAAGAVTSESRRWWPHEQWIVAPVMYGGATLVGLSRMYNNAHWASDVALGAAIGTFSGIKVVRYSHAHADNFIDRTLLHVSASRGGGETRLTWSSAW